MARTSNPSGTVNTSSCHSIHGPPATSGAPASGTGSYQPISGTVDRLDGAAEGVRQDLGAEADRQQRDLAGDDLADEAASAATSSAVSGR